MGQFKYQNKTIKTLNISTGNDIMEFFHSSEIIITFQLFMWQKTNSIKSKISKMTLDQRLMGLARTCEGFFCKINIIYFKKNVNNLATQRLFLIEAYWPSIKPLLTTYEHFFNVRRSRTTKQQYWAKAARLIVASNRVMVFWACSLLFFLPKARP